MIKLMITIATITAISTYLIAGGILAIRLFRPGAALSLHRSLILLLGSLGVIGHSYLLYHGIFSGAGMNLGFFNALSLVSWLIVLLLLIAALRKPIENLGIAIFPFAALAILLELGFPSQHIVESGGRWQLEMHILISILAYSMFTLAMVQAVLLAIQDRHLHNRQPGGFVRMLPPLQTMESLLFQMIGVGFVLLSISLITGMLFLEDIFARQMVHKTTLSIVAWVIFAILLWGRFRFGWRGRKAIRWTLGGFFTLMLAYFGSKLVLELLLGR